MQHPASTGFGEPVVPATISRIIAETGRENVRRTLSVLYGNAGLGRLTSYNRLKECNFVCRRELVAFLVDGLLVLKPLVLGAQDVVQLFDKNQKRLSIVFLFDQRAELMNAVTVEFVHSNAAVLQPPPHLVCSMSNIMKTLICVACCTGRVGRELHLFTEAAPEQ
jgi:hypothetical protein